jgi:hypothetical protein
MIYTDQFSIIIIIIIIFKGLKKKKYQNQPEFFKRALKQIETKFYAQGKINEN